MKCNECAAWTHVAETRQVDGGHTLKRTRVCANGHRFPTFEVVAPVYRSDKRALQKAMRAITVRVQRWAKFVQLAKAAAALGVNEAARRHGATRSVVQRAVAKTTMKGKK